VTNEEEIQADIREDVIIKQEIEIYDVKEEEYEVGTLIKIFVTERDISINKFVCTKNLQCLCLKDESIYK
jgi:hypothetical protein